MSTGYSQTSGDAADSSEMYRGTAPDSPIDSAAGSSSSYTTSSDSSGPNDLTSSENLRHRQPGKPFHTGTLSNTPGKFEPLSHPVPASDPAEGVTLIGFFNGIGVYKVASPKIEEELGHIRTITAIGTRWLSQPVEPREVGITLGLSRDSSIKDDEEQSALSIEPQALDEAQEDRETTHPPTPSPPVPDATDPSLNSSGGGGETPDGGQTSDDFQVTVSLEEDQDELAQSEALRDLFNNLDMSRQVINEYIEIRRSSLGGWGMFAVQDLKYGDPILLETPLLRSTFLDLARDFEDLDEKRKQVYLNLYSYYPDTDASDIEKIWNANAFSTGRKNSVFEIAARFNHSHAPNVLYRFDMQRNIMVMTAVKQVEKGEELLITYGQSPQALYMHYGFCCNCGACKGFSDEDIKRLKDSMWSN